MSRSRLTPLPLLASTDGGAGLPGALLTRCARAPPASRRELERAVSGDAAVARDAFARALDALERATALPTDELAAVRAALNDVRASLVTRAFDRALRIAEAARVLIDGPSSGARP